MSSILENLPYCFGAKISWASEKRNHDQKGWKSCSVLLRVRMILINNKNKKGRKSHLIAPFKNVEQPSTHNFSAPRASEIVCISSSSPRSKCWGTGIRGTFLKIFLTRSSNVLLSYPRRNRILENLNKGYKKGHDTKSPHTLYHPNSVSRC